MNRDKQIEEMANALYENRPYKDLWLEDAKDIAEVLYNAGYRKQIEGKWKLHKDGSGTCDQCNITQRNVCDYDNWQNFCGHCGAKMKGGEE